MSGGVGDAVLAERILAELRLRGRLTARQLESLLKGDPTQPPVTKHEINAVLYRDGQSFHKIDGPFWRPPDWEATEAALAGRTKQAGAPQRKQESGAPSGRIELLPTTEAEATPLADQPASIDEALLREERRRRKEELAEATRPNSAGGPVMAVHVDHPIAKLGQRFHNYALREVTKQIDQDPG
jgi:hypothetical protein